MTVNTLRPVSRSSRRQLLKGIAVLGLSTSGLALLASCSRLGAPGSPDRNAPVAIAARGTSLETTTIRLPTSAAVCSAPQNLAEDFLRAEGFTDVQYLDVGPIGLTGVVAGEIDISTATAGLPILQADVNNSAVTLAGIHIGCFELIANAGIRSIVDLKGKRVAVTAEGSGRHVLLAAMAAYVGVDPNREINWAFDGPTDAIQKLTVGQVDAFMAFPPEPQELRAKKIGHVIVNTSTDRPWSQYFCCVLVVNRGYAQQYPVATKSATRAFLKATDFCASEPERAAQYLVDRGYTPDYGYALQTFNDVPYDRWRDYDPEDTIRFYSLRLQEVGMIKSSPEAIIQRGTDWRFLNELKKELKV
jgi:NitT/TauT family transport system substrate-binding protein